MNNVNLKKNLLFVTSQNPKLIQATWGGLKLSCVNFEILAKNYQTEIFAVYPTKTSLLEKLKRLASLLWGVTHHLDKSAQEQILKKAQDFDIIFIDYSQYGGLAESIKKIWPNKKVITHFHNIESRYAISASNLFFPLNFLQSWIVKRAEMKACRNSDALIFLSKRDSQFYPGFENKSFVCPPALDDLGKDLQPPAAASPLRLLFCGSYFKPNAYGVTWFCREVLPGLKAKLTIVGFGMEKLKTSLESEQVQVLGTVKEVPPYYGNNDVVVSPIFKGSGMKIKSIEALMFNKPLLATEEALIGIPMESEFIKHCETKEDFSKGLVELQTQLSSPGKTCDTRNIYLKYFTISARSEKLRQVIESL